MPALLTGNARKKGKEKERGKENKEREEGKGREKEKGKEKERGRENEKEKRRHILPHMPIDKAPLPRCLVITRFLIHLRSSPVPIPSLSNNNSQFPHLVLLPSTQSCFSSKPSSYSFYRLSSLHCRQVKSHQLNYREMKSISSSSRCRMNSYRR